MYDLETQADYAEPPLTEDELEEILPHRDFCHECDWWHVGVMLLVADHEVVRSQDCMACQR